MHDIKRILVVSRMTRYCSEVVHFGISLARNYRAELYVIHVIHDPLTFGAWNLPRPSIEEDYRKEIKKSKEDLDACITAEKGKGLPIKEIIKEGNTTDEIFAAIKENKIDLVIMSAHEEWRLEHFLFGRSSEEIIRKMPCSVLLLKEEPHPMAF
jgi:nucleotide-binding universal stress UspA family protein